MPSKKKKSKSKTIGNFDIILAKELKRIDFKLGINEKHFMENTPIKKQSSKN